MKLDLAKHFLEYGSSRQRPRQIAPPHFRAFWARCERNL